MDATLVFSMGELIFPKLSMKQTIYIRLDHCSQSFVSSLLFVICYLPCDFFVASSATGVGLGHVTYLVNGMLEYVMGAGVFNVF